MSSPLRSIRKNRWNNKNNSNSAHHNGGTSGSSRSNSTTTTQQLVGSEQWAQLELQKNRTLYHYPINGFVNKIEYTLLYNMISYPNIYPIHVLHPMLLEEDYSLYITINDTESTESRTESDSNGSGNRKNTTAAASTSSTPNHTTTATTTTSDALLSSNCSYAQLTALLALAADKWPPPPPPTASTNNNHDTTPARATSSSSRNRSNYNDNDDDDDDEYEQSRRRRQQQQQQSTKEQQQEQLSIVPTLCQLLIQCIIRHCDQYNLHRETEINELFLPFQKVTSDQTTKRAIMSTLPAYMGLTVTILSGGNPIPFYIGYAMSISAISQQEVQLQNYHHIAQTTTRMSHMETTNLLQDTDHNDTS